MWNQCSNGRVLLRRILQQLAHALSARPVDEAREASDFLGRNFCPEMRIGPCSTGSLIEKATSFSLRIALIAVLSLFPPSPCPHSQGTRPALASAKDLAPTTARDRKSTRLNSSHRCISYAVFCLKKKTY